MYISGQVDTLNKTFKLSYTSKVFCCSWQTAEHACSRQTSQVSVAAFSSYGGVGALSCAVSSCIAQQLRVVVRVLLRVIIKFWSCIFHSSSWSCVFRSSIFWSSIFHLLTFGIIGPAFSGTPISDPPFSAHPNFGRKIAMSQLTYESPDSCTRSGNLTVSLKYISEGPLLPWQRKFGNFNI